MLRVYYVVVDCKHPSSCLLLEKERNLTGKLPTCQAFQCHYLLSDLHILFYVKNRFLPLQLGNSLPSNLAGGCFNLPIPIKPTFIASKEHTPAEQANHQARYLHYLDDKEKIIKTYCSSSFLTSDYIFNQDKSLIF